MGTGYVRNDTSNNIADGNIINAADLDGEFDAIESAMGTSGHTHDGTSAEGGPVTVLGPVQDFVASATEIKPKTTNTLDIGTSGLLFKDMFLDGVATMGSIKIDNAGTIGSATTGDAITISSGGIVTFKDDIIIKDGGTIGVTSAVDAMTVSSAGIVTFKDDIIIKDDGTIGSASDADAITISSGGVVTFSQAVSNLGNVTGKTGSGFVLSLQTSDTTIEATNVLGKIEFSAPDEASGTDAILVGASIEALAEATFDSSTNSTALVFKTNTTGAATERMRLTSAGDLHFLDNRKAIFGAGSDLQIYHDGADSIIEDIGTGNLDIKTNGSYILLRNADGNNLAYFETGGGSHLYWNGVSGLGRKLQTTSTGIDVTGTVTADGLTVQTGAGTLTTAAFGGGSVEVASNGAYKHSSDLASGYHLFEVNSLPVAKFNNGGDISFYEDTGTTAKFFWDASAESLGIGTDSPSAKLDVVSSGATSETIAEFGNANIPDGLSIETNGNLDWGFNAKNSRNMTFSTNQTEAMRIDSSGNVGIGTSSPSQALHVVNPSTSYVLAETTGTGTSAGVRLKGDASADYTLFTTQGTNQFAIYDNAAAAERMRIDSSGNVGIGTSSPVSGTKLTLNDSAFGGMQFQSGGSDCGYIGVNTNTLYVGAGSTLAFHTGNAQATDGSERMRIDSSGNLLVGKTSAGIGNVGFEFNPSGYMFATRSGGYTANFNRQTSDGDIVVFNKDGTTVGSIGTTSSDLYIGTGDTTLRFADGVDGVIPTGTGGAQRDGAVNLGAASNRFQHLYLSGGVHLGGTGAANKLDDYETGYHQTTIQMGSGSATANATNDLLFYTIIGNMCFITGNIGINSVSSPSGTFSFTVPFAVNTALSETSERAAGTVHLNGFTSENGSGIGFIETGSAVYVKTYARNNPVPTGACEMHINIFYPIA